MNLHIGDLVKHKHNGGIGIITGSRFGHSNIMMGTTEWVTIKWIERPTVVMGKAHNRTRYLPAYLEPIKPTDKN